MVIGANGHPGLAGPLTLERFTALPHLRMSFRKGLGGPIDALLAERGLAASWRLTMSDLVAALFVVARTDLVVVGGELVARAFEGVLALSAVPVPVERAALPIFQVWHERPQSDPAHLWLRRIVKEVAPA